jgi:hypothetical protein
MQRARDVFDENIQRARAMCDIFIVFKKSTTPALDLTDLLRAAVVQSVSAFDHLIHELIRIGVGQIINALRPVTPAYLKLRLPLQTLMMLIQNPMDIGPLDQEVRTYYSWQTFQRPDKVADAIRLITERPLWDDVGARLGMTAADVKTRLSAIVDRRDKIAHEADMDPTDPAGKARWIMNETDASGAIEFINLVGHAIFDLVV